MLEKEKVNLSDGKLELLLIRMPKDLMEVAECLLSIQKFLFSSLSIFKSDFFVIQLQEFLIYFEYWSFIRYTVYEYFLLFCRSPFWFFCFFFLFAVQKIVLFDSIPFVYICFCCLSFWCQIQEIIAKANVEKLSSSVFFFFS